MTCDEVFINTIADLRKHWGLSRKEFAKRYGVAYATVRGWERERLPLTIFRLGRMLEHADIDELKRLEAFNNEDTILKLQKLLNLDRVDFAKKLGVSDNTVQRWLKTSPPTHVNRMCRDILNHYLY